MYKLLLFDLDGTLINSADDLANSINYMLKKLNKQTFPTQTISTWLGNGNDALIKRALNGDMEIKEVDEKLFKKAKELFFKHYTENICIETTLYENVKETLSQLNNYKKVIITNKSHQFIKPILSKLQIEDFFDAYFGGDYFKEKKPSPIPIIETMKKFNASNKETIMIGDSKNDILAAKRANIKSIALNYGYNHGEEISKYNPDFIFNNFKDILKVIK